MVGTPNIVEGEKSFDVHLRINCYFFKIVSKPLMKGSADATTWVQGKASLLPSAPSA